MKARTIIVGGLALGGLGLLLAWGFRADPVPVDLAQAARGPMQITINADGKAEIRDVYEVAAPISGQAQRSPVEVGDRVIAGKTVVAVVQPIAPALLDSRSRIQAEAAVAEAEAALQVAASRIRQAEEDLTYAKSQHQRIATLVDRGVASMTQLEDAAQVLAIREAALDAAVSSRNMAQGSLARARAALIEPNPEGGLNGADTCCIELHAPIDGVVLDITNISERPVASGAPLLTIGQPDNLQIVADLLSSDAVRISPGSRAIVERWGGPQPLEAVLRKIEPSARTKVSALGIEEQRVDVVFDLTSPPEQRMGLGDGFSVFLRIVEWRTDDAIQIPLSAIFRDEDDWFVFTVTDGIARKTPVTVGRRNGSAAQVLSGISPGALVVTHPSDRVADGVEIVDRKTLE